MRFKTHFIRRKSAPYIAPLPQSRSKGSISVSIYAQPPRMTSTMSNRDSTISTLDASVDLHSGRDQPHRYVRRPNLAQILSDEAPHPWTLEEFTAYAARNLCLENIEFIQDARKYKSQYYKMFGVQNETIQVSANPRPGLNRVNSAQVEKLKELWTRLIVTYIAPSSPKEINLTADIRSGLLPHNKQVLPPSPELLDPAIKKIEELIEDSILFSFLNEVQASANPSIYQPSTASREQLALETGLQSAEKLMSPPAVQEMLSPMSEATSPPPFSPSKRSPKQSQFNFITRSGSHRSNGHREVAASNITSAPLPGSANNSIAPTLSEDSSSIVSPTASQGHKTPPRTPPGNETEHRRPSPKHHDRWKRMSQKFGFGRKSGSHLKDVAEDQPPLPE